MNASRAEKKNQSENILAQLVTTLLKHLPQYFSVICIKQIQKLKCNPPPMGQLRVRKHPKASHPSFLLHYTASVHSMAFLTSHR